mgnify:CR=1 FL=1
MPTIKITLPESLSVAIRGAESIETPTAIIPAEIIARAVEYGWQQANADAASGAAKVACPADVTKGLEGEAAAKAVKAWMADESNAPAILKVRQDMIRDSIARKLEGEWKAARAAGDGTTVTPLEAEVYRMLASADFRKAAASAFPTVYAVFESFAKGTPTAERREAVLAAVMDLSDSAREWIAAKAQARLNAKEVEAPDFAV